MLFWTTDWSHNDFVNRLTPSTHSGEYGTVASPRARIHGRFIFVCPYVSMGQVVEQENAQRPKDEGKRTMREVTKVRALLGVLAVLVLVAFVAGCGLVPDQGQARHEVKKKVEARKQQAKKEVTDLQKKVNSKRQEVRKKVEAGQEDLKKKVDDLKKKVEVAQEDLEKKVDDVQKDVNDLQKKVNELLKKIDAQQQQQQEKK